MSATSVVRIATRLLPRGGIGARNWVSYALAIPTTMVTLCPPSEPAKGMLTKSDGDQ